MKSISQSLQGKAERNTIASPEAGASHPPSGRKGFALVVTLSLMILLTVIAIGLLSLSTISLRASTHGSAAAVAQANARLALMMAVGELQRTAGPDQRITAPANLVNPNAPAGVTGVWNSWNLGLEQTPNYSAVKSGGNFHGYLMSDANPGSSHDPGTVPADARDAKLLVGPGTVGTNNASNEISAPPIPIAGKRGGASTGDIAWVTMDEGVKSRIDLEPSANSSNLADLITQIGSPARNDFGHADGMGFLAKDDSYLRQTLPKLVSLGEAGLESSPDAVAKYFHDFTVSSHSLQTDVARGGLKTDLSVLFDGTYGAALPSAYNKFVYSDTNTAYQATATIPSPDFQWGLFANYSRLYRLSTAADNPQTGLRARLPSPFPSRQITDTSTKKTRHEPNMAQVRQPVLMPTVVRVDTVFSLVTRRVHTSQWEHPTYPNLLHLMYLPVITLHNPYNVPLRVTNLNVEFSDIPVGFQFFINNQQVTTSPLMSLNDFYNGDTGGTRKAFNITLSNSLNSATEVLMGPGETRIFGTPFPPNHTWQIERVANGNRAAGALMFDYSSTMTGKDPNNTQPIRMMSGLITGPNDGIGFDVDWLAPNRNHTHTPAHIARTGGRGVINVRDSDNIRVQFGPQGPAIAQGTFEITLRMGSSTAQPYSKTQVFYLNNARLKTIMEEGTSPRFPEERSFPATFPVPGTAAITAGNLFEQDHTPISAYSRARPFAVFSIGAKTTAESLTSSRPLTDTGIAFQTATCDFTTRESQGASPLEMALVPVMPGSAGAIEVGGPDSKNAFFFGGHGELNGTTAATFYEIPITPLQSIAQLRHANSGSIGSMPYVTYTVGESRAHPAIPSSAHFFKPDEWRTFLDHSWLANHRLWDSYWFSTLATLQGMAYPSSTSQSALANAFFAGEQKLPNPRNTAWIPPGRTPGETASEAINPDGARSAAHILTRGGFNVNSTSVPAWVSVLSALASSDVPLVSGSVDKDPDGVPFPRMRRPTLGASGELTGWESLWNSYRTLSESEIKGLAELIVEEIRDRGPFLSMSEFVNRRLEGPGRFSNAGAIQSAIDRSNINRIMEANSKPVDEEELLEYGWMNPGAVTGHTGAGAPGEISQGDILSAIGSFISVRSDTFRIRAYGNARDANGKILSQAWCEAILQRTPDYVDSSDSAYQPATSNANETFGRRFQIISFRWLPQNEI